MLSAGFLKEKREDILRLAKWHGAENIRIFGSFARGEAEEGSDVDLLVDLEPRRSLLDLGGLLVDLEGLLGRRVDIVTEKGDPLVSPGQGNQRGQAIMKDDALYLIHIGECLDRIISYVKGVDREKFMQSTLIQDAVLRNLQVLAESTQRLSVQGGPS